MASLPASSLLPLLPRRRSTPPTLPRRRLRPLAAAAHRVLEPLYDDGYLTPKSLLDYVQAVGDVVKYDAVPGGAPRWFCPVECGAPVEDAPLLLYLPDISGVGLGLFMHHRALGRIFEVRCMHVPFSDSTPFEGLVRFVEDVLEFEYSLAPTKPIYLIGHSFGACLALSVAARNPNLDIVLILSNPAISFGKSQLQPFFSILRNFCYGLDIIFPCLLSFSMGIHNGQFISETFNKLSENVLSLLPYFQKSQDSEVADIVSWKLKLLECAAGYCNSHLHAIKAEALILASCLDGLLPNRDEAKRLGKALLKSHIYYLKDHGQNPLLENGLHLSSIIKASRFYRHSRRPDYVFDYIPASRTELEEYDTAYWPFYLATNPAMFSTMNNGEIVRGLSGIPNDGPVLLVGNHMLLGLDVVSTIIEFLRQKKIVLRGLAHPDLFPKMLGNSSEGLGLSDTTKIFGGVPVSSRNFYNLLSEKSHILLYPGGAREGLHRKGEEYTLFWPEQPEFVRMATQFGATIVPFGCVGEDDIGELVLDYNDLMKNPVTRKEVEKWNQNILNLRRDVDGEVSQQDFHIPKLLPKIPGRFYYLFGRPIETRGLEDTKKNVNELYTEIKTEIEDILSYLKKKREEDPYRNIFSRTVYQSSWNIRMPIPSFEP